MPTAYALQNLNIAWDANNGTMLVSGCTDTECAGYVQVSRIDPATCAATPIIKVPTDPPINPRQGAAAFDPSTNTLVMTVTQAGKKGVGLVLVSVDVLTGKVLHVLPEASANVSLVALSSAGPGLFLGLSVLPDLTVALATFDSARNKVSVAPAVPGYVEALPGLSVFERRESGDVFYFVTEDGPGGGARLVGVFVANGTLASSGNLPGDASQAPSALFLL